MLAHGERDESAGADGRARAQGRANWGILRWRGGWMRRHGWTWSGAGHDMDMYMRWARGKMSMRAWRCWLGVCMWAGGRWGREWLTEGWSAADGGHVLVVRLRETADETRETRDVWVGVGVGAASQVSSSSSSSQAHGDTKAGGRGAGAVAGGRAGRRSRLRTAAARAAQRSALGDVEMDVVGRACLVRRRVGVAVVQRGVLPWCSCCDRAGGVGWCNDWKRWEGAIIGQRARSGRVVPSYSAAGDRDACPMKPARCCLFDPRLPRGRVGASASRLSVSPLRLACCCCSPAALTRARPNDSRHA